MQDYHQPEAWQRAMDYAVRVYEFSASLPDGERYNLTSQLRRAATLVPLNIAEAAGCATPTEFARFLGYAHRSLKEVVTALELVQRLHPGLPAQTVTDLMDEGNQISRMSYSLLQRLRANADTPPQPEVPSAPARNAPGSPPPLRTHNSQLKTQN